VVFSGSGLVSLHDYISLNCFHTWTKSKQYFIPKLMVMVDFYEKRVIST
jgi:hypothetical protein